MSGYKIKIKGYKVKDGKAVKVSNKKSVSAHIQERKSKRIKVVKPSRGKQC